MSRGAPLEVVVLGVELTVIMAGLWRGVTVLKQQAGDGGDDANDEEAFCVPPIGRDI